MKNNQPSLAAAKRTADQLLKLCGEAGVSGSGEIGELCEELAQRCSDTAFRVVVIGMFSRGKSTFLNAIMGRRLLYMYDSEATGSITYIANSAKEQVTVQLPGREETFPIDSESYERIKQLVNRQNSEASATKVFVSCPLDGFDGDICFVDTPGLDSPRKELLPVTRKAMQQADAIIMLVRPEGLEDVDIQLLRGAYPGIGKIRPNNLILVINRIGTLLKDRTPEQGEAKVQRVKDEILRQLEFSGLGEMFRSIHMYAVDSLDYLESVDDSAYQLIADEEKRLSQEELGKRSRFSAFRQELTAFLENGHRAVEMQQDILEQSETLCGLLIEYLEDQLGNGEGAKALAALEEKRENWAAIKRKESLHISRYIRERLDALSESVEFDCQEQRKAVRCELDEYIFRTFKSDFDFNPARYKHLHEIVRQRARDAAKTMENAINRNYEDLSVQLAFFVKDSVHKRLGVTIPTSYTIERISVRTEDPQEISLSDKAGELDKELARCRGELERLKEETQRLVSDKRSLEDCLAEEKKSLEARHRREKWALGVRPGPERKYRTKTRTVKKFFFFTSEEPYDDEPYLDYSNVEAYDRRLRALWERQDREQADLDEKSMQLYRLTEQQSQNKRKIELKQKELNGLQEEKRSQEQYRLEREIRERGKLLDRKKAELTDNCMRCIDNVFRQLTDTVIERNSNTRTALMQETERRLECAREKYLQQLDRQIAVMSKAAVFPIEDLLRRASELQGELKKIEERSIHTT